MRTKKGIVTSVAMQNTVTVIVSRSVMHPIYKKRYPVSKKFLADTNGHDVHDGDNVIIGECRPLSKRKHFKIIEVVNSGLVKEGSLEKELDAARQSSLKDRTSDQEGNVEEKIGVTSSSSSESST